MIYIPRFALSQFTSVYRYHGLAVVIFVLILIVMKFAGWGESANPSPVILKPAVPFELNHSYTTLLSGTVTAIIPTTGTTTANEVVITTDVTSGDRHTIRLGSVFTIPGVGFGVVTEVGAHTDAKVSGLVATITTHSSSLILGQRVTLINATAAR